MADQDLQLLCPICDQRFGVATSTLDPQDLRVICTACGHSLSTDEILMAMATSLNDLLDKMRDRLSS